MKYVINEHPVTKDELQKVFYASTRQMLQEFIDGGDTPTEAVEDYINGFLQAQVNGYDDIKDLPAPSVKIESELPEMHIHDLTEYTLGLIERLLLPSPHQAP